MVGFGLNWGTPHPSWNSKWWEAKQLWSESTVFSVIETILTWVHCLQVRASQHPYTSKHRWRKNRSAYSKKKKPQICNKGKKCWCVRKGYSHWSSLKQEKLYSWYQLVIKVLCWLSDILLICLLADFQVWMLIWPNTERCVFKAKQKLHVPTLCRQSKMWTYYL